MREKEVAENRLSPEESIIDLLTFHYVEGFKFNFPIGGNPELTDVKGTPLITCRAITKLSDEAARINTPENISDRKDQSLGALFYLLSGIELAKRNRKLYSDNYTLPGGLSSQGKALWEQLFFLGLAEKIKRTHHFLLIVPTAETLKTLHEKARTNALNVYAAGSVATAIEEIQARLRLPQAGGILSQPE